MLDSGPHIIVYALTLLHSLRTNTLRVTNVLFPSRQRHLAAKSCLHIRAGDLGSCTPISDPNRGETTHHRDPHTKNCYAQAVTVIQKMQESTSQRRTEVRRRQFDHQHHHVVHPRTAFGVAKKVDDRTARRHLDRIGLILTGYRRHWSRGGRFGNLLYPR